jgi:serine phosphatase RsbU (regulator of sigma subunit)
MIALMTDGLIEAHASSQRAFGVQRALECIASRRHQTARQIVESLYHEFRDFCHEAPQDDVTAIVIKVA